MQVRQMKEEDREFFFQMMSNPAVMDPIPQPVFSREEADKKLDQLLGKLEFGFLIWAICLKDSEEFIGLCGLITNDEDQPELAYRFREKFWGNGLGTEITDGLIEYAFSELNLDLIAADVNTANPRSAAILNKFMTPVREFWNEAEGCQDRRYVLRREEWESIR